MNPEQRSEVRVSIIGVDCNLYFGRWLFEPSPPGLIISSCYYETFTLPTDLVRIGWVWSCSCSKQVDALLQFCHFFCHLVCCWWCWNKRRVTPCSTALCVIAILVYVTAVDELIYRPITRHCMATELCKGLLCIQLQWNYYGVIFDSFVKPSWLHEWEWKERAIQKWWITVATVH